MRRLRGTGFALAAALFAAQAFGTATAQAEELSGTLKKIKETGGIALGFRDSSIPFSYLDHNQKPIGYAMDICYAIVDAVKKELKLDTLAIELVPVSSSTRIPLLANGTIDLECGSTTNNPERQRQIAFSNTHFLTATRFISKKANKLNSIEDLKGKPVVATSGTSNIKQLIETNAARHLAFSKPEPCGIMLRKDDPAFKKVVDDATAALYQSAEGPKLYDKWFMQKIPPKGLNLNVPMGAELRHEFTKPSDSSDPDAYKVM
jgi:glutamate/aspartate transport system substrate-binding protein